MLLSVACESAVAMYEVYCSVNLEIKFDSVAAKFDVAEDSVLPLHPEIIRNIHVNKLKLTLINKINPNLRCAVGGHNHPPPPMNLMTVPDGTWHNV